METLWQDLRFGIRTLLKKPGFAMVAVMTLAAGIGLNTAIFSVVNSVLLRPLPYKQPDRLVQMLETWSPGSAANTGGVSPNNFVDWQKQAGSFEVMSAYWLWLFTLTGTNEPTEVPGMKVSTNFFALLGVAPQLGRTFLPEEDQPDKNRVAVISHGFWQRRFGGSADVIGQPLKLDDDTCAVIGVLKPDFRQTELAVDYGAEVWTPLVINPNANLRGSHYLRAIGRLKSGLTLEQAQAEIATIARQLEQAYPNTNRDRGVSLVPLDEHVTRRVRWALVVLQFATGFVLLIACANVANLLLARVTVREKEMAIRSALGAGRWQLVRLLLAESSVLAVIGGAVGFLLAQWGIDLLVSIAPRGIPRLDEIAVDSRVLGFTLALSLVTVLVFGLVPAWQSARVNLNEAIKESGRSTARGQGLRGALVVAEIALTLVLLVGSGLLVRSLIEMQQADLGFSPKNLLTMRVSLLESKYRERGQVANYYQQLLSRIENLPGVQSAAVTSSPPMITMNNMRSGFEIEGQPTEPGRGSTARYAVVSPDYFRTMAIPLMSGRAFTERDTRDAAQVAIINDNFARRYFPNVDPLGKKIIVGRMTREIVGVVGSIRHESPADEEAEKLYAPHAQNSWGTVMLIVRAAGDPNKLVAAASKAVWDGDPEAAVSTIATMDQALSEVVSRPRFNTLLLSVFSILALILASVGLYGVMSYAVAEHTREIGIRLALGAQASDVLKLIVGQGLVLALVGVVVGVAGAFGLTRLMAKLLFGVTPTDPTTFVGVSALLIVVSLLACYVPARRATRVDPMVALRYE
jgi:putative ABC transport system permease protein